MARRWRCMRRSCGSSSSSTGLLSPSASPCWSSLLGTYLERHGPLRQGRVAARRRGVLGLLRHPGPLRADRGAGEDDGLAGAARPVQGQTEDCVGCYECFACGAPRRPRARPAAARLWSCRPERPPAGGTVFVILMLAGVAYDGLLATPLWLEIVRAHLRYADGWALPVAAHFPRRLPWLREAQPARRRGWRPLRTLAPAYVYTLVPIAIAYQVAHYYTYLLIQGQSNHLPPLRPVRVGLEPLRHRRVRAPDRRHQRGVRLVLSGRPHRRRPRPGRVPGAPGLAQLFRIATAGSQEPDPATRAHDPLHGSEPLDSLPTHS